MAIFQQNFYNKVGLFTIKLVVTLAIKIVFFFITASVVSHVKTALLRPVRERRRIEHSTGEFRIAIWGFYEGRGRAARLLKTARTAAEATRAVMKPLKGRP